MRVADFYDASTTSNDNESEKIGTNGTGIMKTAAGFDKSRGDEDEARGVLYCEIETENNLQSYTDEVDTKPVTFANEET